MENHGHSRTKEIPKQINNLVSSNISCQNTISNLDSNCGLKVNKSDGKARISSVKNTFSSLDIPLRRNNLNKALKILNNIQVNLNCIETLKHSSLQYTLRSQQLVQHFHLFLAKNDNINLNNAISIQIQNRNEHQKLFSKCKSIEELPSLILNLKIFKNFKTCQILIHEKGSITAEDLCYERRCQTQHKKIPIKDYNKIYSLIKKSKTKLFNQSLILEKKLGVLGTFIAREISFKKYRIILIISRNDFFPASIDEQDYFQTLIKLLLPIIDELLEHYVVNKRSHLLDLCLKYTPIPLAIFKNTNRIYLNNKGKNFAEKLHPHAEEIECLPLANDFSLIIHNLAYYQGIGDIHHFRRISLLGELLNTLQHELNNPLFGIKLASDLLIEDNLNPTNGEFLDDIASSCLRCQNIIRNFSKLYSNDELSKNIHLPNFLEETLILTKSEIRGIQKEILFSTNLKPESIVLFTNPTWLTQILFNFIINSAQAIKSTATPLHQHKIQIYVDQVQLDTSTTNNHLSISVIDSGPGISNAILDSIMTPFVTTKPSGTGLGLTICKYLSSKINATISFSNNVPPPGATFSIQLPLSMDIDNEKNIIS